MEKSGISSVSFLPQSLSSEIFNANKKKRGMQTTEEIERESHRFEDDAIVGGDERADIDLEVVCARLEEDQIDGARVLGQHLLSRAVRFEELDCARRCETKGGRIRIRF